MGEVRTEQTGRIIPMPLLAARARRGPTASDEPLGEILLFTGVRYERQPEPSSRSDDHRPSGRRRRS